MKNTQVEPIKPKEVEAAKGSFIPAEVIQSFNELIMENCRGGKATILQKEAVDRILKNSTITKKEIFDRNMLDIENTFIKAGWCVKFFRSPYYSTDDSHFEFRTPN